MSHGKFGLHIRHISLHFMLPKRRVYTYRFPLLLAGLTFLPESQTESTQNGILGLNKSNFCSK